LHCSGVSSVEQIEKYGSAQGIPLAPLKHRYRLGDVSRMKLIFGHVGLGGGVSAAFTDLSKTARWTARGGKPGEFVRLANMTERTLGGHRKETGAEGAKMALGCAEPRINRVDP